MLYIVSIVFNKVEMEEARLRALKPSWDAASIVSISVEMEEARLRALKLSVTSFFVLAISCRNGRSPVEGIETYRHQRFLRF